MSIEYTQAELDTVVSVRDMRRVGACVREGQMKWFRDRGFDWHRIVKHGVTLGEIAAHNDGHGLAVVDRIVIQMRAREDNADG